MTNRRPAPITPRQSKASGTVSNPVSGRHEKQKVPRLQLRGKEMYDRDDAVTSSRSMGYMMGGAGGGDSSSDGGSDSDDFEDTDDEDNNGKKRPPHPDILKAILQGVVQCWEETVVTAADPTAGPGRGGAARHPDGDIPSTATSIGDFLSPRNLADRNMGGSVDNKEKKPDNALSLVLLRNMRANNVESKKQVLENGVSPASVNLSRVGDSNLNKKPALFSKVHAKESTEKPNAGRRQKISVKGQHSQSVSRLSSSSRQSDVMETVEEYVADITKDLPQIKELEVNSGTLNEDAVTQSKTRHSSASSTNRKTKLPHSAQSTKSSKLSSDTTKNIDRGSQRSYGRHVRTTNTKDAKKQHNQSRHGSGKSAKSDFSMNEALGLKVPDRNGDSGANQNIEDDEEDTLPQTSFRLPPLKTVSKPSRDLNTRSARSSVSSVHGGHDTDENDPRHSSENMAGNSRHKVSLPQLPSATERSPQPQTQNHREKLPAMLPRLPVSASASSSSHIESHSPPKHDGVENAKPTNSADSKTATTNEMSIDLNSKDSHPFGSIKYKKKLHVYQKSPRANN
ncbi:hypothetical protein ElyMa_004914400 [Elysia marginata]|uniref:Uncharacterized protein n=1 Tax=Elysia marginata TaxID=1093978 RepID=A0AAV4IYH0_9GAST|nr:hypothetical protein ElyMa_004914400 [Elysia marginata]